MIRTSERDGVVDGHGQLDRCPGADVPLQSSVGRTALRQDDHHCPVTAAEDPLKRFLVGRTGTRRVARVGMDPDPRELLGAKPQCHLMLKEFSHGVIVELHTDGCRPLLDQHQILDEQQITRAADPKTANLSRPRIPQIQQLRPRRWREPQRGRAHTGPRRYRERLGPHRRFPFHGSFGTVPSDVR